MASNDDTDRIVLPAQCPPDLVLLDGQQAGLRFPLRKAETVIGRATSADICLPYATVSRQHAVVTLTGEAVVIIEDLNSRNGTFVDMVRVAGPHPLKEGDLISLGYSTLLRVEYDAPALEDVAGRAQFDRWSRDPETGLTNTPFLLGLLRAEHAYARRHGSSLVLVFFRLDESSADPRSDHPAKEREPLLQLARVARTIVRTEEILARFGQSQIVAILRRPTEEALGMAQRVRTQVIDRLPASGSAAKANSATLSAAVVPIVASAAVAPEAMLIAAIQRAMQVFSTGTDRALETEPVRFDLDGPR